MGEHHRHLELTREEPANPRRTGGGFGPKRVDDPKAHAQKLQSELDAVVREGQPTEPGFDSRLLMKLDVDGIQPEDVESVGGLQVVSQENKKLLVLFASEEGLNEFTGRLRMLQRGEAPTRQEVLHAIKGVTALTPDDRTGAALKALGLGDREPASLDVELWPVLDPNLFDAFSAWCKRAAVEILDHLRQPGLALLRVRCKQETVRRLLDHRDVRLVDLPPQFKLDRADLDLYEVHVPPISSPPTSAPVLGILDSGVASNHPLLKAAVADAQTYVEGQEAEDTTGHGTAVAGLALYGDLHECSVSRQFIPRLWLASGRVLDDADEYSDKLIENQVTQAVNELVGQYRCRVFNLSIGDPGRPYTGGHVRGLSVVLDELARRHRVLFVVSAGNYKGSSIFGEQTPKWRSEYPDYLEKLGARIIEPAPAINVLTVGSLARFEASHQAQKHEADPAYQPVARRDEPSPFTRAGPGPNRCIKPEVVEYGGNYAVDMRDASEHPVKHLLGEPAPNWDFIARGRLLSDFRGTSFAAPKLAHLAGLLLVEYPQASANLLRALIVAHSVPPPLSRPTLKGNGLARQLCGYGRPRRAEAVHSFEHCVSLLAEATIGPNQHHYYELPLPQDFLRPRRCERWISVGLSHMPPVRTTRAEYRAARMQFRLVRAKDLDEVVRVYRHTSRDDREPRIEEFRGGGEPGSEERSRGSVQAARYRVGQFSKNDGGTRLFVVVTHTVLPWGEMLVKEQEEYALVVVLEDRAEGEVRYFAQMRAALQARARGRGRGRTG